MRHFNKIKFIAQHPDELTSTVKIDIRGTKNVGATFAKWWRAGTMIFYGESKDFS